MIDLHSSYTLSLARADPRNVWIIICVAHQSPFSVGIFIGAAAFMHPPTDSLYLKCDNTTKADIVVHRNGTLV